MVQPFLRARSSSLLSAKIILNTRKKMCFICLDFEIILVERYIRTNFEFLIIENLNSPVYLAHQLLLTLPVENRGV